MEAKVIINAKVTKQMKKAVTIAAAKKGLNVTDYIIDLFDRDKLVSTELKLLKNSCK